MTIEEKKNLCITLKELGFDPKFFSTKLPFNKYLGLQELPATSEECEFLLLCEIQKWVRDTYKIHINIYPNSDNEGEDPIVWYYSFTIRYDNSLHDDACYCQCSAEYSSYEIALEQAIPQVLSHVQ